MLKVARAPSQCCGLMLKLKGCNISEKGVVRR